MFEEAGISPWTYAKPQRLMSNSLHSLPYMSYPITSTEINYKEKVPKPLTISFLIFLRIFWLISSFNRVSSSCS